jgi:hypothetical protein
VSQKSGLGSGPGSGPGPGLKKSPSSIVRSQPNPTIATPKQVRATRNQDESRRRKLFSSTRSIRLGASNRRQAPIGHPSLYQHSAANSRSGSQPAGPASDRRVFLSPRTQPRAILGAGTGWRAGNSEAFREVSRRRSGCSGALEALQQDSRNTRSHEGRERSGQNRAHSELSDLGATVGREASDAAQQDCQRPEIRESAQSVGCNDDRPR